MLVFVGAEAEELVKTAFCGNVQKNWMDLSGMVSRKKQFVPKILKALQQRGYDEKL